MSDIKPCPFCGCIDIVVRDTGDAWCLYCLDCGAIGPTLKYRSDAIDAWNHRTQINRACKTCDWHDNFSWACCNGLSEWRAEFTDDNFVCEQWELKKQLVLFICACKHAQKGVQI